FRTTMTLHGKSLFVGSLGQTGGKIFHAVNLATNERLLPDFHEASAGEVANVLDSAVAAFSIYRVCFREECVKLLESIVIEIEALGDELLQRVIAETGLPLVRIIGERA